MTSWGWLVPVVTYVLAGKVWPTCSQVESIETSNKLAHNECSTLSYVFRAGKLFATPYCFAARLCGSLCPVQQMARWQVWLEVAWMKLSHRSPSDSAISAMASYILTLAVYMCYVYVVIHRISAYNWAAKLLAYPVGRCVLNNHAA